MRWTIQQLKQYRQEGFLLVPDLLSDQELTALMQTEEMKLVQTLRKDPASKKWMLRGLRWLAKRFSKKDTN